MPAPPGRGGGRGVRVDERGNGGGLGLRPPISVIRVTRGAWSWHNVCLTSRSASTPEEIHLLPLLPTDFVGQFYTLSIHVSGRLRH
jgi:hypothetical protein